MYFVTREGGDVTMDTGEGTFKMISDAEAKKFIDEDYPLGIFKLGELFRIRNSLFKVQGIRKRKLILKLIESGVKK